jgi:uncharacterized protein (TIGR02117 family)
MFFFSVSMILSASSYADDSPRYIFIVNHGWHSGIIVPAVQAQASMPFLEQRFIHPAYYEFGWGDKGFYQADEITLGLALRALFLITDSVMHVVAIGQQPDIYFSSSELIRLPVTARQLDAILTFIATGFHIEQGTVSVAEQGIYGDSQFYTGEGSYHLFNTCNSWTAKALAQAGFIEYPGFKLTAAQLMSALYEHVPEN